MDLPFDHTPGLKACILHAYASGTTKRNNGTLEGGCQSRRPAEAGHSGHDSDDTPDVVKPRKLY